MTVKALANEIQLTEICIPSPEREVRGVYIGDLLSWVMGKAAADNAWITIMSNINTVAVATLADVSCIILAEGVVPEKETVMAAESKGINILSSHMTAYELSTRLVMLEI